MGTGRAGTALPLAEALMTTFVSIADAYRGHHAWLVCWRARYVSDYKPETAKSALIAVIDDDEDVRAALEGLLRSLGYQAVLFANADAFLAARMLDHVDCVISDVQMPGTSGLQLAERIRDYAKPVILITAFPTTEIRQRAEAAGVWCVLIKPFDSHDLIDQLNQLQN